MQKLGLLAKHLLALPGVTRDQMEAFADLGKLIPTGKDLGQGFEVGRFRYDAVISIEDCPAEIASRLLVTLQLWIAENDQDRDRSELSAPDIDITVQDEKTVFVQITVEFDEPLSIVPDPEGPILFDGSLWRVSEVPIDTAETLDSMEKK